LNNRLASRISGSDRPWLFDEPFFSDFRIAAGLELAVEVVEKRVVLEVAGAACLAHLAR
jgi:hypothetical protein